LGQVSRKPRGRPRKPLAEDPDRRILALALVFREWGVTRKGAVQIAVALIEGRPVALNPKAHNRRRQLIKALVSGNPATRGGRGLDLLDWKFELRARPGAAATIEGRARTLSQKMRKAIEDQDAGRLLAALSLAWEAALDRGSADQILEFADRAGEREFALAVLIPLSRGERAELLGRAFSHPRRRKKKLTIESG
jgi:hypothetical protein